ncbi:MAG: LysR family transcriptional regulator [Eubacterium sp.]|nr:LysR family transcriptional regulator [Eubacterium sp.]
MTDKQIKCFQVLAEHLNYTKAAQILEISQSTLSTHIAALERGFGFPLFIRTNRSVELSPEGEVLIDALEKVTHIWQQAQNEAAELRLEKGSVLKLGILEGQNTEQFYRKVWKRFQDKHPDVELKIRSFSGAELIEKLDEREVDAIFGYQSLLKMRKDLDGVSVYQSPLYLVTLKQEGGRTQSDIGNPGETCFVLQSKSSAPFFNQYFEEFCRKKGEPQKVIRVSNIASVLMNVELGLGTGLVDDMSIIFREQPFEFTKTEDIYAEYCLIFKRTRKSRELKLFLEELTVSEYHPAAGRAQD